MKLRKRAINGVTALIVLLSLVFVLVNTIVNGHVHKLANGMLLFHAHPFDRKNETEPVKSHHHTGYELFFYDQITHLIAIVLSTLTFGILFFAKTIRFSLISSVLSDEFLFLPPERAPPLGYVKIIYCFTG